MSWTCLRDSRATARKPHRCDLCGCQINRGTRYVVRISTDGVDFGHHRMHEDCEVVTRDWDEDQWEGYDEKEFLTEKEEYYKTQTKSPKQNQGENNG